MTRNPIQSYLSVTRSIVFCIASYTSPGTEIAGQSVDFTFNDTSMIAAWAAGNNAGLLLKSTGFDSSGFGWH